MLMLEPDPDAVEGEQRSGRVIGARIQWWALSNVVGLRFSRAGAATDVRPPPPCWATDPGSAPLDRLQRADASRRRDRGAGALGNQPPGITLVVDLCGRGARRSGTGGAVVHALERDAVALLLAGRLGEGRRADGGKGGGQRAGQRQRQCGGFGIHGSRLLLLTPATSVPPSSSGERRR